MTDFEEGALMAVSLIVATHDMPVVAADVLNGLSLHDADCSSLDEYDKANLRKVQGELRGKIRLRGL